MVQLRGKTCRGRIHSADPERSSSEERALLVANLPAGGCGGKDQVG